MQTEIAPSKNGEQVILYVADFHVGMVYAVPCKTVGAGYVDAGGKRYRRRSAAMVWCNTKEQAQRELLKHRVDQVMAAYSKAEEEEAKVTKKMVYMIREYFLTEKIRDINVCELYNPGVLFEKGVMATDGRTQHIVRLIDLAIANLLRNGDIFRSDGLNHHYQVNFDLWDERDREREAELRDQMSRGETLHPAMNGGQ